MLESDGEDAALVLLPEPEAEAEEAGDAAILHPEMQTAESTLLFTLSPAPALLK